MAPSTSRLILRLGLAFAFAFPAIDEIFDPYSWLGYFPGFLRGYVPDLVLLHVFGAVELVIALWLLSNWRVHLAARAAFVILVAIVILDRGDFAVLFRDLSIASIALALSMPEKNRV